MVRAAKLIRGRAKTLTRCWAQGLIVLAMSVLGVCSSAIPAVAAATGVPQVGWRAASAVSTSGATIEVPVNPEGGETSYEIWLACQSAQENDHSCEPLTVSPQRVQGVLSAGFEQQIVTDPVSGLQPGYLYEYDVIATNSAGREGYIGDGFLTCPTEDSCPTQPLLSGLALWVIEGAEREAKEAPRIAAEEQARQKEAQERPVKEAAERATREREVREAGERAGKEAAERAARAAPPVCIVPRLEGDSLRQARHALKGAHCRLGKLTRRRSHRGALVVVAQSPRSASKLAAGSAVTVTLSRAHKP